jgi:hypothetical protein
MNECPELRSGQGSLDVGRRRLKLASKTDPSFAVLADRCGIPEPALSTSRSSPVSPSPTGRFGKMQSGIGFGKNGWIGRHLEPELPDAVPLNLPLWDDPTGLIAVPMQQL